MERLKRIHLPEKGSHTFNVTFLRDAIDEMNKIQQENANLKNQLNQTRTQLTETVVLRRQIEELTEQNANLQNQLEERPTQQDIENLQARLQEATTRQVPEDENLRQQLAMAKEQIENLQNQLAQTTRGITETKQLKNQIEELREENANLQNQLRKIPAQDIEILQARIQEADEEIERLKTKSEYYKNQIATIMALIRFSNSKKIKRKAIYRRETMKSTIENQIKRVIPDIENYRKTLLDSITINPMIILNELNETVTRLYLFDYPEYFNILSVEQNQRDTMISNLAQKLSEVREKQPEEEKPIEQLSLEELRKQVEEDRREKRETEEMLENLRTRLKTEPSQAEEIVEEILDPYFGEPGRIK